MILALGWILLRGTHGYEGMNDVSLNNIQEVFIY